MTESAPESTASASGPKGGGSGSSPDLSGPARAEHRLLLRRVRLSRGRCRTWLIDDNPRGVRGTILAHLAPTQTVSTKAIIARCRESNSRRAAERPASPPVMMLPAAAGWWRFG